MAKTHYITNEVEVYSDYARDLGGNGLNADKSCSLKIAPEVNGNGEWLYMTTNGDDVLIGWLDEDGGVELDDDVREWVDSEEWLRALLESDER